MIVEPERLPATARDRHYGPLTRGEIEAKCDFLRAAIRMKDEIVDRAPLNEDAGVVRSEPMEIVDGQVMREHVVVLALHREPAPVYGRRLPRATDDAEIPRFSGQNTEIERLDQLARTRIRSYEGVASRAIRPEIPIATTRRYFMSQSVAEEANEILEIKSLLLPRT